MRICLLLMVLCILAPTQSVGQKDYQLFTVKNQATSNVTLKIVILDQKRFQASVFGITSKRQNGMTPLEVVLDSDATIALGSGFVTSFSPLIPNGFLKIEGKVISKVKRGGYNGILGVDDKGYVVILPWDASAAIEKLRGGFQVGPTLIRDGKKREQKANLYTRSFCGLTKDNKVVIGVALDPMDLNVLSNFLLKPTEGLGQIQCTTAINLAGGGSEALVVGKGVKVGNYDLKCASILGFKRR